jgi:hypothetical protein
MSEPPNADPAQVVTGTPDHSDRALLEFPSEHPEPMRPRRPPAMFRSSALAAAFGCGLVVGGVSVWSNGGAADQRALSSPGSQTHSHQPTDISLQTENVAVAPSAVPAARPVLRRVTAHVAALPASTAGRSVFHGALFVESEPAGAQVFLNGRAAGRTPLLLENQAVGSQAVRVALDGYTTWTSAVQIVTDRQVRVWAQLRGSSDIATR